MIELHGMIRPSEDIALYRAEMAAWPGSGDASRLAGVPPRLGRTPTTPAGETSSTDSSRRGRLLSRDFPDTCEVAWSSSGWTNNQNVRKLLDFMVARGEIAVADATWT